MNREEFLNKLEAELSALNTHERCCALEFYEELISDGKENGVSEEELIAGFGTPREVAEQILADSRAASESEEPEKASGDEGEREQGEKAEPAGAEKTYSAGASAYDRHGEGSGAEFSAKGEVKAIVIDASNTAVELHPAPEGPVRVHFNATPHDRITVTEEDGTFAFHHRLRYSPFSLGWLPLFGPRRIVVDVPADYSGTLSVKNSNAGLYAAGLRGVSEARFATSNAKITLHDMEISELEAQTSNASVDLQGMRGASCDVKTSDGRITASDCDYKRSFTLHTSNAPIRFWNLVCGDVELSSSNASVCGGIVGDAREYAIKSHTSNASNNLPARLSYPDQKKSLRVHTSNAKIDVRFEG